MSGTLSKMPRSSAAGGIRTSPITFFIKSTHAHCSRDSDTHHSTMGAERQAKYNLNAPASPHFYCSAWLIYFPPSLWLVEFIRISLVIKSLVNKHKTFHQFTQMFYCLTSCLEVTHGAEEKNVISILFYPPGQNGYLPPASVSLKGLKCLLLHIIQGGKKRIHNGCWVHMSFHRRNFRERESFVSLSRV